MINVTAGPAAHASKFGPEPVLNPLFMVPQPQAQAAPRRVNKQRPQTVTLPRSAYRLLMAGAIAGTITVALGFLIALGCAVAKPANTQPTSNVSKIVTQEDRVTDFNDGFSESKSDDCQQGFKAACDWLNK